MNVKHPSPNPAWEDRLRSAAASFPYPRTPDLAGRALAAVQAPGTGRAVPRPSRLCAAALRLALAAVVLLLSLLAVPGVRAALVEFLRFGPVRIFLTAPTPSPTFAAPTQAPTLLPSLLELAGRTSLESAQARVDFPIRIPGYPQDLGLPDYVFLQDLDGPALLLAWSDPDNPAQVALALQQLSPGSFAVEKFQPERVESVEVHGKPALWTSGPYLVRFTNGELDLWRMTPGHVLIWREGDYTYRLETGLPLETAVKIAESLQEWEPVR